MVDGKLYSHKLFKETLVPFRKKELRTLVLALNEINIPQRVIVIKNLYKKDERK